MRTRKTIFAVLFAIAALPARAMTYDLSFDNDSAFVIEPPGIASGGEIVSDASFNPITMFDGDTISFTFNSVPTPTYFPQFDASTEVRTTLYGLGGSGAFSIEDLLIGP